MTIDHTKLRALAEVAKQHLDGAPDTKAYAAFEMEVATPDVVIALLDEVERLRNTDLGDALLDYDHVSQQLAASQAECERLRGEVAMQCERADTHLRSADTFEHRLLAMTLARDELAEIAEDRSHPENADFKRISALRKVGGTP